MERTNKSLKFGSATTLMWCQTLKLKKSRTKFVDYSKLRPSLRSKPQLWLLHTLRQSLIRKTTERPRLYLTRIKLEAFKGTDLPWVFRKTIHWKTLNKMRQWRRKRLWQVRAILARIHRANLSRMSRQESAILMYSWRNWRWAQTTVRMMRGLPRTWTPARASLGIDLKTMTRIEAAVSSRWIHRC